MFGLVKLAAEAAIKEQEDKGLQNSLGLAGIAGGGLVADKSLSSATGVERLYHGTDKENAESIRQQGILGSRAGEGRSSQRARLTETLGEENVANKSYVTRDPSVAKTYAIQQATPDLALDDMDNLKTRDIAKSLFPFLNRNQEVVDVRIPYQHLQDGTVKEVPNPELRGLSKEEWVESQKPMFYFESEKALEGRLGASYKSLDAPNTLTVEGDIPTQYIKGSDNFQRQTFREFIDYAKSNPGRFSRGALGVGTGAGLTGLGATHLYNANEDRFKKDQ